TPVPPASGYPVSIASAFRIVRDYGCDGEGRGTVLKRPCSPSPSINPARCRIAVPRRAYTMRARIHPTATMPRRKVARDEHCVRLSRRPAEHFDRGTAPPLDLRGHARVRLALDLGSFLLRHGRQRPAL